MCVAEKERLSEVRKTGALFICRVFGFDYQLISTQNCALAACFALFMCLFSIAHSGKIIIFCGV